MIGLGGAGGSLVMAAWTSKWDGDSVSKAATVSALVLAVSGRPPLTWFPWRRALCTCGLAIPLVCGLDHHTDTDRRDHVRQRAPPAMHPWV